MTKPHYRCTLLVLMLTIVVQSSSLHAQTEETLNITVRHSSNGEPLDGVLIELLQDGLTLAQASTDAEGHADFSVTVVGTEKEVPRFGYSLGAPFPNPTSARISVPLTAERPGFLTATVHDALGRLVTSLDRSVGPGKSTFQADLAGLPPGSYFLTVRHDGLAIGTAQLFLIESRQGVPSIRLSESESVPPGSFASKSEGGTNEYQLHFVKDGFVEQLRMITLPSDLTLEVWLQPTGETFTNSIGIQFTRIPAGSFQMGSNNGSSEERPVHTVTISKDFFLGKHEVTQGQWQAVMGSNPSRFSSCGANCPVEQVSRDDIQEFIQKLNDAEGSNLYRLPTEAEWEYAARAGTTTDYSFGNDTGQLRYYAWYGSNSGLETHPVGTKLPNPWGLFDVIGNVFEWVNDWYDSSYYNGSPTTDPPGASTGSIRVLRGGCWNSPAGRLRSAERSRNDPGGRRSCLGFRLLRTTS